MEIRPICWTSGIRLHCIELAIFVTKITMSIPTIKTHCIELAIFVTKITMSIPTINKKPMHGIDILDGMEIGHGIEMCDGMEVWDGMEIGNL